MIARGQHTAAAPPGAGQASPLLRFVSAAVKAPIHLYRWTVKPFLGRQCRHLPTCSEYSLEAIDRNGPWRGFWLTVSRLSRCHFWGTAGLDLVPDIRSERHPLAPWRYGRWTGRHMPAEWRWRKT